LLSPNRIVAATPAPGRLAVRHQRRPGAVQARSESPWLARSAGRRMARRMRPAVHPGVHLSVPQRRVARRPFPPAFTSSSPGHGRGAPETVAVHPLA